MIILINNHTNLNADTVYWIHPLDFTAKSNSDDNPTWGEAMNDPHKYGY